VPAISNAQVTKAASVAAVVMRGQLMRSGSGRRKAVFPMFYPDSVRQRFIQPRLFMVYIKKTQQNYDTADGEVSSLKRKRAAKEMCLSAPTTS
jgi:hypothetical protein